jgi:hypothetical protein
VRDLLHSRAPGGKPEKPRRRPEPEGDTHARTEKGEKHAVVLEEVAHGSLSLSQSKRLG